MKNMNDEIKNLSMADDENDYDEYEEEVIERDEEYDDEDDYDEEYDDEEYDDEDDYEDEEEYDDEEPYDEEYDDGYDDQYYDDRLNKVLDELAELKRGMTPAVAQPQYPSVQPHLLFTMPQQNNNEVVMYNEISRLRDELSKTQNSQSLHVELSKLKEDMEREKRQNETQFLSEIKRLNERIEELQQPEKPKAIAASGNGTAGYLEAPRMPSKELNKLIGISESLLHNTTDSDSRIISEISELKNQVGKLPDIENANKTLGEIRTAVKALEERPETSEDIKAALAEISAAISALKKSSEESSGSGIDKKLINKLSRMSINGGGVDLTEIMRSVYELKGMLGSNDQNQQSLVNMALKAYTDLDLLHATIANSSDFRAKLEAVDNFVNTVNAQDFITSDAFDAYNIVLKNLMDTPLERSVFDAVCSFASATGKITVSAAKKDAVAKYISFAERAKREEIDSVLEFLPEMISAINDAEGAKNVSYNSAIYSDIQDIAAERKVQSDDSKKRTDETEIKALICELASLKIGDVVTFSPTMPLPTSNALTFTEGDSVSDRLNLLVSSVENLEQLVSGLSSGEVRAVHTDDDIAATADAPIVVDNASGDVTESLENLKSMLLALEAKVNLDDFAEGLRQSLAGIANRLAKIENNISAGVSYESPIVEPVAKTEDESVAATGDTYETYTPDMNAVAADIVDRIGEKLDSFASVDNRETILADLESIKEKLSEQDSLLAQIGELRADILSLPESLNQVAQFDKLYDDVVAQFDKLYDDLSAFDGDLSDKINERLNEIKDAVDGITASDLSSAILDGIVDFRASFEENQTLSSEDRNKILEDLAFVKEQVQTKLNEQSDGVTNDEIAAQIKTLGSEFADNLGVIEAKIAALETGDTLITEQYSQVSDKLEQQINQASEKATEQYNAISDKVADISVNFETTTEVLNEIKEKSSALEDMITANGLLAADNQNAITDELNRILEQLTPPQTEEEQDGVNIYDEILAMSDKITQISATSEKANEDILSSLSEIKEQVHLKELEQNLAAVSATEEEQQTLLKEIASLRERLSGLETLQKEQADSADSQLAYIADQITVLVSDSAEETEQPVDNTADEIKAISGDIAEIKDKLFRGASDDSALNMQVLLSDVAEIKDRLNDGIENSSDFIKMSDDLTFIRNQIEANMDTSADDDNLGATLENEGLSLIMDDIATIKEKLASFDEYDTVAEILSLREDVKSARILDNNDVASELEGLKNDLSELKADIADIRTLRVDSENVAVGGPTGDEVNMLLSEIVSLRDEIQDYKDDVANIITAEHDDQQPVTAVADENIAVILDELNGLHNELAGVREENFAEQADEINEIKSALAEVKDMIARRTTLPEGGAARNADAASHELNVVLDEIINLKDEVGALKSDFTAVNENIAAERESDEQAEKAVFADELRELKSELYAMVSQKIEEIASEGFAADELHEELQSVKDQLADLQALAVGGVALGDDNGESHSVIANELNEIKDLLLNRTEVAPANQMVSIEDLYAEVAALRSDIEASKIQQPVVASNGNLTVDLTPINDQIAALREQLVATVPIAEPDETVLNEVLVLRDEVAALREQMANVPVAETESEPDTVVLGEILSLREELTALREQINNVHATVPAETDEAVLGEVLSLREELAALREQISGEVSTERDTADATVLSEIVGLREEVERLRDSGVNSDETATIMEAVDAIKEDVRAIKEEPDLSIINEVLALRDEFQAFKDELNKTRTTPAEDKSKSELVAEVQSLRDQLFAISMANVNDGTSNEVVYESYNNIILDEISALRDEIAILKQSDETRLLAEELSQMKDKLTNLAVDDSEKTEARFEEIKREIAELKRKDESDVAGNAILTEIAALKEELFNQREADTTTLNFMSEMAKQLERRDSSVSQSSTERLTDEIENLKDEIAASLASDFSVSEIKSEIENLKEVLRNTKSEAAVVDNSDVLKELATLKKEIDRHNSEQDTKQILKELARLKDDIGAMAEKEPGADADLSRSINDLKAELNQIAEFVDEGETSKPQPKKKSQSSRSKSSAKSGTKRKAPKAVAQNADELSSDELLSKINATRIDVDGFDDNMLAMNPAAEQPQEIPATSVEMDIAARLAKQVANKLIMEQLVQQLGDGGVPQSEVEEIVKDILPQEFATIQIDEQTDKVRRLANSLVLDKLRSRLRK